MSRPAAECSGRREAGNPRRVVAVIGTMALCGTIASLQQTLVVPLLPAFPVLLGTSAAGASWLITVTLLTGAVAIPIVSRLADMYGKKRMVLVVLGITVVGSMIGALATTLPYVIVARAMQGVPLALIPVGMAVMRDELPRERVPLGVALMSATLAVGAGAGLPLSGVLVEHLGWHAIFWVTGGVAAVLLVLVPLALKGPSTGSGGSFDYAGAVILSIALASGMVALSKGVSWGWVSSSTLALLGVAVVLLAILVPVELRRRTPLVDIRVSRQPAVLLVNLVSLLAGFAMFTNMVATPQILQRPAAGGVGFGLDVLHTGLWMVPTALVFGLMAPVSAGITRRLGPQTTLLAGTSVMTLVYVNRYLRSDELWQVVGGAALVAVGSALSFAAMPTLIMRAVPITETAAANGLNMLCRHLGTAGASAAAGVAEATMDAGGHADALTDLFAVAAIASSAAALLVIPMFRFKAYSTEAVEPVQRRNASISGRGSGAVSGP